MNNAVKYAAIAMGFVAALSAASGASATVTSQAHHARRAEVNARLERQTHRIKAERLAGELTGRQAHALRAEVRGIRNQERADAAVDHGRITRAEQRQLNREENAVSRQIGK